MERKSFVYIFVFMLLIVFSYALLTLFGNKPIPIQAMFSEITPTDLSNSITVKGTVESTHEEKVYTSLPFRVKEVMVRKGDRVEEGQLLCILDTEDLDLNLEQIKAELDIAQQTSITVYENAKRLYEDALTKFSANSNAQEVAAQNALEQTKVALDAAQLTYNEAYQDYTNNNGIQVEAARISLENAQKNYDEALNDYNNKTDPTVMAAESAVNTARLDLEKKETAHNSNVLLYESGVISEDTFTTSKLLYEDAANRYNDAQSSLESAKSAQERLLFQLENALKAAKTNYEGAVTSQKRALNAAKSNLDAARIAYENALSTVGTASDLAKEELEQLRTALENAETALNKEPILINIRRLEKQLTDSIVRSPINGTVTAVYAEKGSLSTLLFIVEDTDNLRIDSRVKEYDYSSIFTGVEVIIRSDSTGDNEYQGVVSFIDPAAIKNPFGEMSLNADVEFGIKVDITSTDTPLKIGMNTRLDLILEKKTDIYKVRYDAVTQNDRGEDIVLVAENSGLDTFRIKQVPVDIGMTTDFYLEISGRDLADNMKVINDASTVVDELTKLNKRLDRINSMIFRFV